MRKLLLLSLFISAPALATVYGSDTRQIIRPQHEISKTAKSVALMVPEAFISSSRDNPDVYEIETNSLENSVNLCSTERFSREQGIYVGCTGFLVAPDILVTAGHCSIFSGEEKNSKSPYCTDFSWYFDFEHDAAGKLKNKNIPKSSIYRCKEIIHVAHISEAPTPTKIIFNDDYSIIRLDRPVTDREPLKLTTQRPQRNEIVTLVGHPLGMAKTMSYGPILSNEPKYDLAATSGFPGNSGSPVFNSKKEVFGILVRGYPEGLISSKTRNDCYITNRCSIKGDSCTSRDEQTPGDHIMPLALIKTLKDLNLLK